MTDLSRQTHDKGRALWRSVLTRMTGDAYQRMIFDRMTHPQVGDLVIEISSFAGYDPDGVGWLRGIEYAEDSTLPERFVVQPLHRPGERQGWRNAEFVALPHDRVADWPQESSEAEPV
jgi:hypothetical protein